MENQSYQNSYQQPARNYAPPQNDGALGWEDEIRQEHSFVLLPAGDYAFEIIKVEKARYDGGDKISACPKANVTFRITTPDGQTVEVQEGYLLHTKMEWKLSEFFAAIGMKRKGEPRRMNWSPDLIGKRGVCKLIVHKYKKDGDDREINRIDKLYPSYDQPVLPPPAQPSYQAPQQGYRQSPQGYTPPQNGWR